ncbi:MAG: hypothetical protein RLZZ189_1616, partial [Pseudomonadota bacterium]
MNELIKKSEITFTPEEFKKQLKQLSGTTKLRTQPSVGLVGFDNQIINKGNETPKAYPQRLRARNTSGETEESNNTASEESNPPADPAASYTGTSAAGAFSASAGDHTKSSPTAESYASPVGDVQIAALSLNEADIFVAQATTTEPYESPTHASASASASTPSYSLPVISGGLAALALGIGKAKGGSGTSPTSSTTPANQSVTLTGFIAAGPVINNGGLQVDAYDTNGNLLVTTTSINTDGTFSLNLSNLNAGILKLVVSDTNGSSVNYMDEATGAAKSLDIQLTAIINFDPSQPNTNININPLTSAAASLAIQLAGGSLNSVSTQNVLIATQQVADAFGLSTDTFITAQPNLIIDTSGAFNSAVDTYGLALAISSVLSANPGIGLKAAIVLLASNNLYASVMGNIYAYGHAITANDPPTGNLTVTDSNGVDLAQAPVIQGQILTATSTINDADGIPVSGTGAISYAWQASVDGSNWTPIDGASGPTATSFTTTQAQVNQQIRVVAIYTDNFGNTESVNSAATAAITTVNNLPTAGATISGTTTQGQTLTADPSTIVDLDGIPANATFSYQWQTSADRTTWSAISGATSNTLLLAQAQVGLKIRVATSYTDSSGKSETANSAASTSVQSTFVSLGLKAPTPIPNSDTIENVISFWIGDINGDGLADWLLGT